MLNSIARYTYLNSKIFLLFISYLSIDVTLGAAAVGCYFWKISEQSIPLQWYFIFPLAVYGVYNLDHWLDIRSSSDFEMNLNPRRKFHKEHSLFLRLSILVSIFISFLGSLFFLSTEMILTGLAIGSLAILHFLILNLSFFKNSLYPVKEMTIAIIYCLGTAFPILLPSHFPNLNLSSILLFIFLFSIVWNNLLINAISDYEEDKTEGFPSLPIHFGIKKSILLYTLSTLVGFICILVIINLKENILSLNAYLVFMNSLILPFIVLIVNSKMKLNKNLVRILGELPFILFFLA